MENTHVKHFLYTQEKIFYIDYTFIDYTPYHNK